MKNKVLYLIPPAKTHRTAEENLGVGYLAAYLRQYDIQVKIIDAWLGKLSYDCVFREIDNFFKSDGLILFVGISTYVSNIEEVKTIVAYLRGKYSVPIVAGGFGPSFFQKEFLDIGIDIISIGEGEVTNFELCQYFQGRIALEDVHNIAFIKEGQICTTQRGQLIANLDSLPYPARDTIGLSLERKSAINVLSARGCMGHCTFCSVIAFQNLQKGNRWRERSIENFVDEIDELYKRGVNFFKVIDDSFIEYPRDEEWCKKFADELEKRNIVCRFRGSIIADYATEGVVRELKRAGFFSFACGIENFSATVLERYGKRASSDVNSHALTVFEKNGIYVQCGLILFDPYTTMEEIKINLSKLKQYRWVITKGVFTELYAAKGTRFTNKLLIDSKNGDLIPNNENYLYRIMNPCVRKVYEALKLWHQQHARIYDRIIDPLVAPKNITNSSYNKLYKLYRMVHDIDLDIFEYLIGLATEGNSQNTLKDYVMESNEHFSDFYTTILNEAEAIYIAEGLFYDGLDNKYIMA